MMFLHGGSEIPFLSSKPSTVLIPCLFGRWLSELSNYLNASDVCWLRALSLGNGPLISGPVFQITEGALNPKLSLWAGFSSKNLNENTPD